MNLNNSNLPAWLENSKVFRSLYLFRKLYLSNASKKHFSQFAEDVSIARIFRGKKQGFYVDVGCFHPKKHNNTWKLYKRGWRGINIDVDEIKIAAFDKLRPLDTNIACAVSSSDGEVSYYSNGFYSLTVTLDEDFARKTGKDFVKKTATCKRLSTILDESPFQGRQIDLLTVDAEAHDLEVLQSLDFSRYRPRLVAVESHHPVFTEVMESDIYRYLVQLDYSLVGWSGLTLLMANPELQEELRARPL